MTKLLPVLALSLALLLPSCAPKQLTPEEAAAERERQIKMVERVYPDKKPDEVIKAADRVIRLADDDYQLSHNPNGFTAYRRWAVYLVLAAAMGEDTWTIDVRPHGTGSKLVAVHSATAGSVSGVATGNGGVAPLVTPLGSGAMTTFSAPYQLFFSRVENLLYGKGEWLTCKKAKKIFTEGPLDPLCLCANDRTPDGVSAMQRERAENGGKDKEYDMGLR